MGFNTTKRSGSSGSSPPPRKQAKLEEDPVESKLRQYLHEFAIAVRTGEFVVQTELNNVPLIGLKVIETGKMLKFPLQEDEVSIEELTAAEFEVKNNEEWVKFEASILNQVRREFGLPYQRISVSLKQLIIQKPGNTFPTNLDELFYRFANIQGGRMTKCFGHLVIQLPSHYSGGHFRFEHEGQVKEFDMSASVDSKEGWTTQYLAYYAQLCQNHGEILSGVRSCLVYNLEIESFYPTPTPRAPTIKNIVPSFPKLIQEWKQRSGKTAKLLPFLYTTSTIQPTVISRFLAPTLRDNGVTLFLGKFDAWSDFGEDVITKLRVLACPRVQVEEAFANFLRDEPIDQEDFDGSSCDDDQDPDDIRGLKFDLNGYGHAPGKSCPSEKFLFLLSGNENVDLFKNKSWIKDMQFWRFQSYLFLQKCEDFEEKPTTSRALVRAAESLVSLEIDDDKCTNLFPNLPHFKNLLDKFLLLQEDTQPLQKLLQICAEQSDFDTLFPTLLKSTTPFPILKSVLQNLYDPNGPEGNFYTKVGLFMSHVETVFHLRDANCEEFYFDVLISIPQNFQQIMNAKESFDLFDATLMINLFRISEVMKYNLFGFVKSLEATFVREVMVSSCMKFGSMMGVMWVKLVTDLYCCTNLLETWTNERVGGSSQETYFLAFYFQLAEKVGADVKGMLGNVRKYGVIVQALKRVAKLNKKPGGIEILPKFWIPFMTRLESRIEAVLFRDVGRVPARLESCNFSFCEGMEMLQDVQKLLEVAKKQQ